MALPLIFGGLALGAAAWAFSRDDDDSSSPDDKYEQEEKALKKAKEAKRKQLNRDIEAFKKKEKKRIQQKYNAQIDFSEVSSSEDFFARAVREAFFESTLVSILKTDKSLENKINALEDEQDEIKELIAQLKNEQNATN